MGFLIISRNLWKVLRDCEPNNETYYVVKLEIRELVKVGVKVGRKVVKVGNSSRAQHHRRNTMKHEVNTYMGWVGVSGILFIHWHLI